MRGGWVLALVCLASACGGAARSDKPPAATKASGAGGEVTSNVGFEDYAGTQACAKCHASHVERWLRSPMHNMTREAAGAKVSAPFDGAVFRFKDDTARFDTAGGARFVTIDSKRYGAGVWKITRVIGGHHREDYAGVQVGAARPDAPVIGDPSEEHVLPISFVYATKSFRYKGYSVMVKERAGLRIGPVWNQTCIFCHNTPPYVFTVLGALAGKGGYQGEVVDPLLPPALRAHYKVTDPGAFSALVEPELARLGAPKSKPTPADAVAITRSRFRASHLVEVGIGCEACHLGSAEHVRDPSKKPSFEPRTSAFAVDVPSPSRATRVNRVCARCHQVLFSGYEPTWEGGARSRSPGGSHINSGEARDMMLGACASKLTCVECHDPHAPDATAHLRSLEGEGADALCTRCHDKYSAPEALRAHAHHDPSREGARCLSCHMPKKNMSLDGTLSRYHRIGSPTEPVKLLLDRPIECALCHTDQTVESLAGTVEKWWKKPVDRDALRKLYGALDANVLLATTERGKPHEQAVAFQLLGDARDKRAVPALAQQLTHPYPLVRGYAKRALDAIEGAPVPIDIDADDAAIEAAARAWIASSPRSTQSPR